MFSARTYVVCAVISYLLLVTLFWKLKDNNEIEIRPQQSPYAKKDSSHLCNFKSLCFRLCCADAENCNENHIEKFINDTLKRSNKHFEKHTIIYGRSNCSVGLTHLSDSWEIKPGGSIRFLDHIINIDEYCFQDSAVGENLVEWNLLACEPDDVINSYRDTIPIPNIDIRKYARFIFESTCVLLLGATIVMKFAVVKDFGTTDGKCDVLIVLSLILTQVSLIVIGEFYDIFSVHVGLLMVSVGFHFTCLWLSVMSVNVCWTFLHFCSNSDHTIKFKSYCFYATLFTFLLELARNRLEVSVIQTLFFSVFTTFRLGASFLVIAYIFIYHNRKHLTIFTDFEIDQFKALTDRFWDCVAVYGIVSVNTAIGCYSWNTVTSEDAVIVINFIKCFSAALIFALFGQYKKNTTLTKCNMQTLLEV